MTKLTNLASIEQKKSALQSSISPLLTLDWKMKVFTLAKTMGLPLTPDLYKKSTPIVSMQLKEAGFETLSEFITAPLELSGANQTWDDWVASAEAAYLSEQYSIRSESRVAILEEFKSVYNSLGRQPATAAEFHHQRRLMISENHNLEIATKNDKIRVLEKSFEELKSSTVPVIELDRVKTQLDLSRSTVDQLKSLNVKLESQVSGLIETNRDQIVKINSKQAEIDSKQKIYEESEAMVKSLRDQLKSFINNSDIDSVDEINRLNEDLQKLKESFIRSVKVSSAYAEKYKRLEQLLKATEWKLNDAKKSKQAEILKRDQANILLHNEVKKSKQKIKLSNFYLLLTLVGFIASAAAFLAF